MSVPATPPPGLREPVENLEVLVGMNRAIRRLATPVMIMLWPLLAGRAAPARTAAAPGDEGPSIYLTWHAPYGMPGATNNLTLAAGDTTREDTLYLTCDPATDSPMLRGLTGNINIRPAIGDSLGPYWRFAQGGGEPTHVRIRSTPDSTVHAAVPWSPGSGVSAVGCDYSKDEGKMAVIVAVPTTRTDSIEAGKRYVLARLLFRHPPAGLSGFDRPMCLEWWRAVLALTEGRDLVVTRGDRFASWNSPGCEVCRRFRGPLPPKPWMPKKPPSNP